MTKSISGMIKFMRPLFIQIKKSFYPSKDKFFLILSLICIFGAFVPIRYSFITTYSYLSGQYSDFLTFSLHLLDVGLLFIVSSLLFLYISQKHKRKTAQVADSMQLRTLGSVPWETIFVATLLMLLVLSLLRSLLFPNLGFWLGLSVIYVPLVFIILGFSSHFRDILQRNSKFLLNFAILMGCAEVFLGSLQIIMQSSVGLPFHMEPILVSGVAGVATIVTNFGLFMRPYGTFLHPNVLAGFLCILSLILLYRYTFAKAWERRLLLVSYVIIIFGLYITVSRTALLAWIVGSVFLGICDLFWLKYKKIYKIITLGLVCMGIFSILLWPVVSKRIPSVGEVAVQERADYNRMGIGIIKQNWVFGVGVGQSLLHMEQYAGRSLKSWEHQPVHNYFLLVFAELGLVGLVAFCLVGWVFLWGLLKGLWHKDVLASFLLATGLCFVILMLGDHYLYTLRSGQVLLGGYYLLLCWYIKNQKPSAAT